MNKSSWDEIKKVKDPSTMFDMVIFNTYLRGQFQEDIPVEEAREVFKQIKKQLKNYE